MRVSVSDDGPYKFQGGQVSRTRRLRMEEAGKRASLNTNTVARIIPSAGRE